MAAVTRFVGIDVAKATLDVAVRPSKQRWQAANTPAGIATVVRRLRRSRVATLVVLEATGGYEHAVVAALAATGIGVVVANPRQVRDFARGTGQLAKTDAIDAGILALFAERVRPAPRPLPTEAARALDGLLARRRQLLEMLTAEKNRLQMATGAVQTSIAAHIAWLERELGDVDGELEQQVEASPVWQAKEDLLRSVPGIGPVVSRTLMRSPRSSAWRRSPAIAGPCAASAWCGAGAPQFGRRCTWVPWWAPDATRCYARSTSDCVQRASRARLPSRRACGSCW
jgi:transposase